MDHQPLAFGKAPFCPVLAYRPRVAPRGGYRPHTRFTYCRNLLYVSASQFATPTEFEPGTFSLRNRWADKPRTADYGMQVLSRVVSYVLDPLGRLACNPCGAPSGSVAATDPKSSGPTPTSFSSKRRAPQREWTNGALLDDGRLCSSRTMGQRGFAVPCSRPLAFVIAGQECARGPAPGRLFERKPLKIRGR